MAPAGSQVGDESTLLRMVASMVGELVADLPADVDADLWSAWLEAVLATVGPAAVAGAAVDLGELERITRRGHERERLATLAIGEMAKRAARPARKTARPKRKR